MRMKKLIVLAAVAIATVACSRTFDTAPAKDQAVGFGSWTNTLTRARTIGGTAFDSGDFFFVYGYTSGAQTPFDGTKVSYDGTDWTYSPLRFWDRNNDNYHFYAISPSESTAAATDLVASHDVTDGTMTTVSLTLSGKNNDILVADSVQVIKAHYGEVVNLNFRHAGALLDVKVRKGAALGDNGVLKITAVTLENINKTGTLAVTGYNAPDHATAPKKAILSWTSSATGSYVPADGVNEVTTISAATPITTTGDQFLFNNLVVMPQTFAASQQRVKISYTITTGTGADEQTNTFTDKTYDLVLFDKTDYDSSLGTDPDAQNTNPRVTGWLDGVHYTYVLTIDAEAIVFSASMESWATDDGYYYLIN